MEHSSPKRTCNPNTALQLLPAVHVCIDKLSLNDVKRRLEVKQTHDASVKIFTTARENVPRSNVHCSEHEECISLPFRILMHRSILEFFLSHVGIHSMRSAILFLSVCLSSTYSVTPKLKGKNPNPQARYGPHDQKCRRR